MTALHHIPNRTKKLPPLRVGLRTGDTPAAQRQQMVKLPPHILVTTPESLHLCLTALKSRANLAAVRTVIIDALFYLDEDRAVAYFVDLIGDSYFWLRMRVLELLAQISHYRSIDVLSQFVNDDDELVRSFITSVLLSRGILSDASVQQGEQ